MNIAHFIAAPGKFNSLREYNPGMITGVSDKHEAAEWMKIFICEMQELQDRLYADNRHAMLIIFQAMDGAGKDSTIKKVMSGINPQGCQVFNFKQPSMEELDHDFLWRTSKCLPERGRIGIFNRSYYEEVLVARVHPEIVLKQYIPGYRSLGDIDEHFWRSRFESINNFEAYMVQNGTQVVKFFLNVSKKEQAERFLKRIDDREKNWKFSISDLEERKYWDDYQVAYENMIGATSTEYAPWYIIPADKKWYMQMAVANIVLERMKALGLEYPVLTEKQVNDLQQAKKMLMEEV